MEKKGSFFIFLVIIAVLTLIIAALVSFIMLVGINSPSAAAGGNDAASSPAVSGMFGEPPDEASLDTVSLLDKSQPINLKSDDPSKPAYALVSMSVKYFIKIDGIKDVQAKITLNKANLQEIATTYFMAMGLEEFSKFETKAKVKEDLKKEMNEFLLSTISTEKDRRKVKEVIYDVIFSEWNYG